jgi:hypothetical protein
MQSTGIEAVFLRALTMTRPHYSIKLGEGNGSEGGSFEYSFVACPQGLMDLKWRIIGALSLFGMEGSCETLVRQTRRQPSPRGHSGPAAYHGDSMMQRYHWVMPTSIRNR